MRQFTYFSQHGAERLAERTQLKQKDLIKLLDNGLCVRTGSEPGIQREHLLFWSEKDQGWFVAVRDSLMGMVVTVLTLEYHYNLAWSMKPTEKDKEEAKRLVQEFQAPAEPERHRRQRQTPTTIQVTVNYEDEGGSPKFKRILNHPSEEFNNNPMEFVAKGGLEGLDQRCIEKGVPYESVNYVLVRFGSKGEPLIVHGNARA